MNILLYYEIDNFTKLNVKLIKVFTEFFYIFKKQTNYCRN